MYTKNLQRNYKCFTEIYNKKRKENYNKESISLIGFSNPETRTVMLICTILIVSLKREKVHWERTMRISRLTKWMARTTVRTSTVATNLDDCSDHRREIWMCYVRSKWIVIEIVKEQRNGLCKSVKKNVVFWIEA